MIDHLTLAQQNAVRRTGQDVCVVAGPGSGKTSVLIERFAWLVEERGIDPTRILAITFTEKAATEIKERLIARFAGAAALREAIERAWVATIDGFCARLLREHAIAAGLAPDFTVLDQPSAERLKYDAAEEALDALFGERPDEMRRLLEALDLSTEDDRRQPDLARSLREVYEVMRVSGVRELPSPPPAISLYGTACELVRTVLADSTIGRTENQRRQHQELRMWAAAFLTLPREPITVRHFELTKLRVHLGHLVKNTASREAASQLKNNILPGLENQLLESWNSGLLDLLRAAVARIDALYRDRKRRDSALDFGDLEEHAIRLLESDEEVFRHTAGRFDQILMDELQDTNRLQWRLVNLIRRSFFAVGDINQSIYGFRHADPVVFEDYRRGLQEAGAVIDDLRENHRSRAGILAAVSAMLDGQTGIESRPLIAVKEYPPRAGSAVERLVGRGLQNEEVEASLVAARIRQLVDSGECKFCEIAVLVRTLGATAPFERAFDRFDIPFLVSGGRTFLEAREILDLMGLLAALVNPLDEIALVGVLRGPLAGMSDEEIFRIGPEGWRDEFQRLFGRLRAQAGYIAPDRLLAEALDESGYAAGLADRARANIEKFLGYVRREHRRRPRPLAELLEDLEALRATQSEAEASPAAASDVVHLMSIHAAKGLEFQVVFAGALHRGPDRRRPVIAFSPQAGLGAKWRNPASGKGQSDTAHAAAVAELKQKEEAEENRLLYVAMTRAKSRLILSYAERERGASDWQKLAERGVPSITEADQAANPPPAVARGSASSLTDEILFPPVRRAQYDSSAAVTAVSLFQACPRKYFLTSVGLTRLAGLASDDEEALPRLSGTAAQLGMDVHRILAGEAVDSREAQELAGHFASSVLGRRLAHATRIEREFDFVFYIEDVVLKGQIDLWFEENGELVLVDYKTDRYESPEAYGLQLRLYALALERYAGRLPDRAVLYYLRSDRMVGVSLDPAALGAARAAVRAFSQAQDALEFPLKVGQQCRRCEFFGNGCPAQLFAEA